MARDVSPDGGGSGSGARSGKGSGTDAATARLERARWRSRRGLLELELLLKPFVDGGFERLTEAGKSEYERLLEHDDMDVHEWLIGRVEPPEALRAIVAEIRGFLKLG